MKKWILLTALSVVSMLSMAQDDDMYFVPTKKNVEKVKSTYGMPRDTYYSGSNRSVDDYNRRNWQPVAGADSTANDVIDFSAVRGVYPDSIMAEGADGDYQLARRMERFDDYTPSEAYWDGYRDGRWSSPWYATGYYPWYDTWYDPWYMGGGWYGYYRPWGWYASFGWGGWYRPWGWGGWYGPRIYASHRMTASPSIRYYDRRNYRHDGSRVGYGGSRANSGSGYVGSGNRTTGNIGSGSRSTTYSGSSRSGGSNFGSGARSGGSVGGGFSGGGSRGGGGGRVGGGRR